MVVYARATTKHAHASGTYVHMYYVYIDRFERTARLGVLCVFALLCGKQRGGHQQPRRRIIVVKIINIIARRLRRVAAAAFACVANLHTEAQGHFPPNYELLACVREPWVCTRIPHLYLHRTNTHTHHTTLTAGKEFG